ncbi:GDSL-type esterase/lipase family protein [Hyphomonas sp.]|uniref:GDSL-type esterase/lipase family protein n=1 Tax=Hyphomonas sp. TaxID=87 RepID=UPI00391E02C0
MRALALGMALSFAVSWAATAQPDTNTRCAPIPASAFPSDTLKVKTHTDFAEDHFRKRIREFRNAPLECGKIVMLGDSLTELNDWAKTLPSDPNIRNRGISGDTSDGVLTRLEEITSSRPRAVFLLIGTNDIWTRNSPRTTVSNIRKIVNRIHSGSPDTIILVQTVFPLRWGEEPNRKVRAINSLLKKQSRTYGFILLDTHRVLVDSKGALKDAYTDDGLHLNNAGNAVWSTLVSGALREYNLGTAKR